MLPLKLHATIKDNWLPVATIGISQPFIPFVLLKHAAKITARWWSQIFFLCSSLPGEMIEFD